MDFPALKEAEGRLDLKRKELAGIWTEAGPELDMGKVKSIDGDSAAKVAAIRALNDEINDLNVKAEGLRAVAKIAEKSREDEARAEGGSETVRPAVKAADLRSVGEMFTASAALKGRPRGGSGPVAHLDVDMKSLFTTSSWVPETTRNGRVIDYVTRPIQITELIPQVTTDQIAVTYMEETVFTSNAAEVAEAGAYPESALAYEEKSSLVRKISTWMPTTDESLLDVPGTQGRIDNRLGFMVMQRLDLQILLGNGTAPNLRGILNTTGIQTQALGGDVVADAVYKAIVKVRVTGQASPNAIAMHPNDWQGVRLTRTVDGIYIWGAPSEIGVPRMWGLPVVEAQAITENTALVGDFANYSELAIRKGLEVQVTNAHEDFFTSGKLAIRADIRAALTIYRPAAFCTVTGI